jgi:two-component system, sensor histidine kinase
MMGTTATGAEEMTVDFVCVAGELLRRMTTEPKTAVANNSRLSLAMTTAGHDLRQRLHLLMGTVDTLTRPNTLSRFSELAGSAKSQIIRLSNELDQIALYASCGSGAPCPIKQPFEVAPILDRVHLDWCSDALGKDVSLSIARPQATVQSDPYLFAVIVNNLVANAVRYTLSGEVRLDCEEADGHLVVQVKDTGPGIPDAVLRRAIAGIDSDRPSSGGLGLGLSIVTRTADLLGHKLTFNTVASESTRVSLHVPLSR